MRNLRKDYVTIALIIIFNVTNIASPAHSQIVCDEFRLLTNVEGDNLVLSVVTDLPDNTIVMVGVSRSYLEKGNLAKYSLDYFSEKSTVGKWKSQHTISIASKEWKSALRAKQENISRIGLGFDVASISDDITVSMIVPINQPDPRFGERNSNLTGKSVTMASKGGEAVAGVVVGPMYIVEDKTEINYPLDQPPVGKSPPPRLDPLNLEIGQTYIVSKQTPLMPSVNPPDPISAIQQMKYIPKDGIFKVLEVTKPTFNPWYKVIAFSQDKQKIGTGWINSSALFGQKLKQYREQKNELFENSTAQRSKKDESITYSIISSDTYLNYKRSLEVRLNKKVSKENLREIALKLKSQDPKHYERTFISYLLPDMEPGKGAWATTHFDPDLEIQILGLTIEEENFLRQLPDDSSREVIGFWLDESLYGMGCRITIFRQNGKLFIENTYKDGSNGQKEVIENLSDKGRTFRKKEGSSVGEYYLIDNHGNLQLWDEEGYILTAKRISTK